MAETPKNSETSKRTKSWWSKNWFYITLVLVAVVGGGCAFTLPYHFQREGDNIWSLRQAILAATGGVLAILTLWENRRKNIQEKEKNDQDHTRQVHAERRARYAKAIEQLADDKSAIHLGGVYTLAKLVDDWLDDEKTLPSMEKRRQEGQVIIDSLCAYIRSSFPLAERHDELTLSYEEYQQKYQDKNQAIQSVKNSADNSTPKAEKQQDDKQSNQSREEFVRDQSLFREEEEVRQTILLEIKKRLIGGEVKRENGKDEIKPGTWSYFKYDFSNAFFFYPVGFRNSYFGDFSNFFGAKFTEGADFFGAKFTEEANFFGAKFTEEANFLCVKFIRGADFSGAEFTRGADFYWSANFSKAEFTEETNFSKAKFTGGADFSGAEFTGAEFTGAEFTGNANFYWSADFSRAEFTEYAEFPGVKFTGYANFPGVKFTWGADFSGAEFTQNANFPWVKFTGYANFCEAKFTKKANFGRAEFTEEASFPRVKFTKKANFCEAKFTRKADFSEAKFDEKPIFEYALDSETYKARFSHRANPEDYNFEASDNSRYKIETEEKEYDGAKFIIPKGTELFDPDEPSDLEDDDES